MHRSLTVRTGAARGKARPHLALHVPVNHFVLLRRHHHAGSLPPEALDDAGHVQRATERRDGSRPRGDPAVALFAGAGRRAAACPRPPAFVLVLGDDSMDSPGAPAPENWRVRGPRGAQYRWREVQPESFAADPLWADLDGDRVPDFPLGRIPARTPDAVRAAVAKTLAWERRKFDASDHARLIHWLARILENEILDARKYYRAQKRDRQREKHLGSAGGSVERADLPSAGGTRPSVAAYNKELQQLYDDSVAELPDVDQEVILLREYAGASFEIIAEELGRPTAAAARDAPAASRAVTAASLTTVAATSASRHAASAARDPPSRMTSALRAGSRDWMDTMSRWASMSRRTRAASSAGWMGAPSMRLPCLVGSSSRKATTLRVSALGRSTACLVMMPASPAPKMTTGVGRAVWNRS